MSRGVEVKKLKKHLKATQDHIKEAMAELTLATEVAADLEVEDEDLLLLARGLEVLDNFTFIEDVMANMDNIEFGYGSEGE